jgi:hypothetical protein
MNCNYLNTICQLQSVETGSFPQDRLKNPLCVHRAQAPHGFPGRLRNAIQPFREIGACKP